MKERIVVTMLALTAAGFSYTALQEGYSSAPITPVPGDKLTIGMGSTARDDGTPVQAGDRITPPQAIRRAVRDMAVKESSLRRCFGEQAKLYPYEWDAYVDLSYNVGASKVCNSSIVRKVQSGQYEAACRTILDFKKVQGRDCFAPENAKFCGGIPIRRREMAHQCLTGERP
jgi:lysozyme